MLLNAFALFSFPFRVITGINPSLPFHYRLIKNKTAITILTLSFNCDTDPIDLSFRFH